MVRRTLYQLFTEKHAMRLANPWRSYFNRFMNQNGATGEERFHLSVGVKFQLYNGLFLSLPFDQVEKTGILLSLFLNDCEEGFRQGIKTPEIVENFLSDHTAASTEREKIDLLLRFVQ